MQARRMVGFVLAVMAATAFAEEPPLLKTLEDKHAEGADFWFYNDMERAFAAARKQNKPLMVTFRCVPCEDCKGFDAEVAQGNEAIGRLAADKFIPVRQVEMKGVDLTQFQFDYDLNWAAMFLNADGTVYARYGTQSAAGADAYNSIAGLESTMRRVLALHENYPENKHLFAGKRGPRQLYARPLNMPGMPRKEKLAQATTRQNCIHCHMIHDAQNRQFQAADFEVRQFIYRYPLPENLGLILDRDHGREVEEVLPDSPAAAAGLSAGDEIELANGQVITSIADLQWVLHHLPAVDAGLTLTLADGAQRRLQLPAGWKKTDISWRGSMWSIAPRLNIWMPEARPEKLRGIKLGEGEQAYEIRWINRGEAGGRHAYASGLREGDVVVAIDGKPIQMSPVAWQAWLKLNRKPGDILEMVVVRDGQRIPIKLKLMK